MQGQQDIWVLIVTFCGTCLLQELFVMLQGLGVGEAVGRITHWFDCFVVHMGGCQKPGPSRAPRYEAPTTMQLSVFLISATI